MIRYFINVLLIHVLLISCSPCNKKTFSYKQSFSPISSEFVGDSSIRLVFADVREELSLSAYAGVKANWILADNGVKVVGSRNKEVLRRKKLIDKVYNGQRPYAIARDYRVPWLTLSMGDLNWCDYTVSTTVNFEKQSIAGIAFRYLNSREYYAFILDAERGVVKLVLRKMDQEATADRLAWDELQTVNYKLLTGQTYNIKAEVDENKIICSINDSVIIKIEDSYRNQGKVALIADEPVEFGPVTVAGKMSISEAIKTPEFAKPELVYELPLPGENVRREFYFLDPDSDGEREIIISEQQGDKFSYRCIEFDGTELWKIDDIKYPTTESGDFVIQVFDINGDGKNEIVAAIDFQIQVRDGKTGELLKTVSTPNQNPYFDSRNYPYQKLLGDAICPVKNALDKPLGFYIKDRYTNIWLYDNNLNQLWHKALGTGHFPLPVDINNDGVDEILACHTLLKADGSVIWKLPLEDHIDNIAYVSLNPDKEPKYFYLAAGEMGLLKLDPSNGEILKRFEGGHIQAITIADFLPEKEGLELLTVTTWREDQIRYLFDKDLNLVSTWSGPAGWDTVPWGINGRGLLIGSNGIVDPLNGELLYACSFGRVLNVLSDSRWGNALVVTEEDNYLKIYSSSIDSRLKPVHFLYDDLQSLYLPKVSTNFYK